MSTAFFCAKEEKPCVRWVEKYFKDCLCNLTDDFSFAFGLVSLLCWGMAEIPQIITNFRAKSSHGVSLAFLLTWILGDAFNLLGCLLEPATLPTQFYTALLYTTSTVVLLIQSLYYDHIYRWLKCRSLKEDQETEEKIKPLLRPSSKSTYESEDPTINTTDQRAAAPQREFYFTSARSLASSATPPFRTYLRVARSGPSAMGLDSDSSSEDEATQGEFPSNKSVSQPRPIPRSAGYSTFVAAAASLPAQSKAFREASIILSGRKLLNVEHQRHSTCGQWLGWLMAAIYMGGRLPQIWLNMKRGSVEGLNPLMFIFALIANATYVASILVRNTEWENTKANMPWLLDAAVCVALDLFIILQYVYYRYQRPRQRETTENEDDKGHKESTREAN